MPVPENPKVGGCYIWVISFLLFVFTISGAVFLILYVMQPVSTATSGYAVIGVSLVFLPWFFWVLTFLYRVVSRCCGFRIDCFSPFGSGHPDAANDKNAPAPRSDNVVSSNTATATAAAVVVPVGNDGIVNDTDHNIEAGNGDGDGNEDGNGNGGPRRVHFGGVVILGEEIDAVENQGSPKVLSRSSSSSSSSSGHSHESEKPLRLSMA